MKAALSCNACGVARSNASSPATFDPFVIPHTDGILVLAEISVVVRFYSFIVRLTVGTKAAPSTYSLQRVNYMATYVVISCFPATKFKFYNYTSHSTPFFSSILSAFLWKEFLGVHGAGAEHTS